MRLDDWERGEAERGEMETWRQGDWEKWRVGAQDEWKFGIETSGNSE